MTAPTTYVQVPTATATCPATSIVLGGTATADVANLHALVSAWSDGATAAIWQKLGTLFHAAVVGTSTNTTILYAMGTAATATAAANGAYITKAAFTLSGAAGSEVMDGSATTDGAAMKYLNAAAVTADGLDYAGGSASAAFSATAGTDKYGMTVAGNSGWDATVAVDTILNNMIYLPTEPATIPTGETDATGDRWNTADVVSGFIGVGAGDAAAKPSSTSCFSATTGTLTLGALQLAAAGASAFAAAMAF